MTRKGHTEEQVMAALQQAEAGAKTGELCRNVEEALPRLSPRYAGPLERMNRANRLAGKSDKRTLRLLQQVPSLIKGRKLYLDLQTKVLPLV
jgi:hypothetical protein